MKPPSDKKKNGQTADPPTPPVPTASEAPSGESRQPGYYHAPPNDPRQQGTGFDPRMILILVATYWWIILLFLVLGVGASVTYVLLATPKYMVRCQYQIYSERLLEVGTTSTQEAETRRRSREVMLRSAVLRDQVINKLRPEWDQRVSNLNPDLYVERGNPGTVLVIRAKTVDKDYGLAFLQELTVAYEQQRKLEETRARERAMRGLRLEKRRREDELRDARQRLMEFTKRHELKLQQMEQALDQTFLNNLMKRANTLQMERTMIEMQLQALEGADAPTVQDVLSLTMEAHAPSERAVSNQGSPLATSEESARSDNGRATASEFAKRRMVEATGLEDVRYAGQWRNLEQTLAQLQTRYDQYLRRFKPGHPEMEDLKQRMAQVHEAIQFESDIAKRRLRARHEALQVQENAIKQMAKSWETGENTLTLSQQIEYGNLRSEVGRLQTFSNQISDRLIDVAAKSGDPLITQMVQEPTVEGQTWPKPIPIVGGSAAGSLGFAFALALALLYFDSRFQDVVAIEQQLNLPFIGGIPTWERVIKNLDKSTRIVMDKEKPNAVSESYRSLRISLDKAIPEDEHSTLMITSADAGEGKTVTTANMGIAFAWVGKRVLLVDADFRRPNLHNVLGLDNPRNGLTQLLQGKVESWRDLVQKTDYANVDFIPAGKFSFEATETCSSQTFKKILQECKDEYDLVILDTAPVGRIVETAMIARACNATLMVALHGKSSVPSMRHALRRLEGCNVLGFCLNAIDIPKHHAYKGYYGYKWRYGLYSYYYYYSDSLYGYETYTNRQEEEQETA